VFDEVLRIRLALPSGVEEHLASRPGWTRTEDGLLRAEVREDGEPLLVVSYHPEGSVLTAVPAPGRDSFPVRATGDRPPWPLRVLELARAVSRRAGAEEEPRPLEMVLRTRCPREQVSDRLGPVVRRGLPVMGWRMPVSEVKERGGHTILVLGRGRRPGRRDHGEEARE
jgi:hypothetical protein